MKTMACFLVVGDYDTSHIMNNLTKEQILQEISAISTMERGKLSAYSFKERSGRAGPYHKLQHWQDGKNHTRYIPADDLPAVQAALAGYTQYQQLTEAYAELVITETRQNLAAQKKRKATPDSPRPSRGNPTTDRPLPGPSPTRSPRCPSRDAGAHGRFQVGQ